MAQVLDLASNRLTGSIEEILGNLPVLKELRVNNNQLSGNLPRHFMSSHIEVSGISWQDGLEIGCISSAAWLSIKSVIQYAIDLSSSVPSFFDHMCMAGFGLHAFPGHKMVSKTDRKWTCRS